MSLGDSRKREHKTRSVGSVLSSILVVTAFFVPCAAGADWPGFRGRNVDGVSTESSAFPEGGAIGLEITWKRAIGSGYSGTAIAGGFVVTCFSDGTSDVVVAFDESSGDERWRFEMDKTHVGLDGSHTGPIATPLIAGGRVFGLAPRGRLFGLDLESGSLVWSTNLADDHEASKPHYGFATSPFMQDGVLIVQIGSKAGAIGGFDPTSGKRLWAVGDDGIQYQSPIPLTLFGRPQVVATGNKKLFGIDASKGAILWEYEHGGGGPRGAMSLVPVPAGVDTLFMAFKDDASTVVRLTGQGDKVEGTQLWESRAIRNSYNVPVYHDGHIYAYSSRFLTCVEASTGEVRWRSRKPGDGFTIIVDGRLVILTKHGAVHIVEASPDSYKEVASLEVFEDMAWAPPSFANGHILARGLKEIARLRIRSAATASDAKRPTTNVAGHARFARFLTEVGSATDKSAAVDRFMKENKHFPITENDRVHFVYRGPGDDLAVASDIFGARQERAMARIEGTDFFYHSEPLEADARVNYVFIQDYEVHLTDSLNPLKTTTAVYGKEMEMSFSGALMEMSWFAMPRWKAPDYLATPDASRRGNLKSQKLNSELEGTEISFDVYVPAGYEKSSRKYPVAYIHGGKMALERGEWQKALDNLIGSRIEPIIAVFVNYAPPVFRPSKYAEMFVKELVPLIDKEYRTIDSPKGRASVGAGFTGATAVACTFQKPHLIGKLGCQSPVMFGMSNEQLEGELKPFEGKPLDVYIEWGKYDLRNPDEAWDMAKQIEEFSDLLSRKGQHVDGGEVHDGTGWSSWRNRTDLLLAALFPVH